jgi:phage/plasmid-associated DNA primase
VVDDFLNDVLVKYGDREQRMIFEEYLGYTIFDQNNSRRKMLFMIGESVRNGKSTLQLMVQGLLGENNFCSLHIHQISEKNTHILPELENKMACFEDDAQDGKITSDNLSYLKSLVSSNS